jgi:hypothetical protein
MLRVIDAPERFVRDPRYRPHPRAPFTVAVFAILGLLVTWISVAVSVLIDPERSTEHLCAVSAFGLVLILALVPLALRRVRSRLRMRTWLSRNEDALALLRRGDAEEAVERWDELAREAKQAPLHHTIYLHNLAAGLIDVGEPAVAAAVFRANLASGWPNVRALGVFELKVSAGLALALALAGELDEAERVRASIEPKLSAARRGSTLLVDAVIAARRGRAPALGPESEIWRDAEAQLMPRHARALRGVMAFVARASLGSAYRDAPQSAEVSRVLAITPPIVAGELSFLAARWPAMGQFLEEIGLASVLTHGP